MTRKVSLWIVIALVAALAASLAAVVVLANDDGRGSPAATGAAGGAWHQAWDEGREAPAAPTMGSLGGWERRHDTPLLPWVLFALATGTAVGLLVAWGPWRAQPATATAGPPDNGGGSAAREGATQTIAVDEIVADHAAVPEMAAAGAPVADGSAVEDTARPEDEGRSDETADASAADDTTTRETPPQA